jgi:hypothetical protein
MGSSRALLPAYALSAVAVLAAVLGSLVVMETATVKLTVPSSKVSTNLTINGGPNGRDLTTTHIQASVTDSVQVTASTVVVPPAYASGQEVFTCSPCPATPIDLKEGTVVSTAPAANKVHFATLAQAQVSAGKPASVAVRALIPGVGGNVAAKTVTVMDQPITGVTVTNPTATTGGVDSTATQVVAQSDLDVAQALLTTQSTNDLNATLKAQAEGLDYLPDGQPTLTASADHKVGDQVSSFTMTMTATLGAIAFSAGKADALMRAALSKKISKGFQLTTDPIQTAYQIAKPAANGEVTIKGTAVGVVVPNVTADDLRSRIKGMRVDAAKRQLLVLAPGATIDMVVKPNVPWLPVLQDHIAVTIIIEPTGSA